MKAATITSDQKNLINRFKDTGGVVDYVVLDVNVPAEQAELEHTHHQAVIQAMSELSARVDAWAEKTALEDEIPRSSIFQIHVDRQRAARIAGKRITNQAFLGTRYHHERKGLIVEKTFYGERTYRQPNGITVYRPPEHYGAFVFFSDSPEVSNIVDRSLVDDGTGTGYAYAFSSPPHGVRLSSFDLGELFEKLNDMILGGVSQKSVIFEWPTDWSNYFDAGHEWWGSFLWSIANPPGDRITVIAASTTD